MTTEYEEVLGALKDGADFAESVHDGEWPFHPFTRDDLVDRLRSAIAKLEAALPLQPLTDEQVKRVAGASDEYWATSKIFILAIARAIEKEHGIGASPVSLPQQEGEARDAARYRWLCEQDDSDRLFIASGKNGAWGECGHSSFGGFKDIADAAIDEAMSKEKGTPHA